MKEKYIILNCEGNILKLEIENSFKKIKLAFFAKMNNGTGEIYFPVQKQELIKFFNSKLTLSQIIENSKEDIILLTRYDKEYLVSKSEIVNKIQCGSELYSDILYDLKMNNTDIEKMLSKIS